jgi:hypothetical protein
MIRYLPPQTQVVLLSATLPYDVLEMTTKFTTDPIRILVKRGELILEGIKQFLVATLEVCVRHTHDYTRRAWRDDRYPNGARRNYGGIRR